MLALRCIETKGKKERLQEFLLHWYSSGKEVPVEYDRSRVEYRWSRIGLEWSITGVEPE